MVGEITYSDGRKVIHREMTDEEVKCMFNNIRLNTGFSFPDQLIQDFMDGDIVPTFKKCLHFNREDFRTLVRPILKKKERKRLPRPTTQRKSKVTPIPTTSKAKGMNPKNKMKMKMKANQKTGKRIRIRRTSSVSG